MFDREQIVQRIRTLRKEKDISQEEMAVALGVYQSEISRLECGKKCGCINDIDKLCQIAELFDVSLQYLLFGDSKNE